MRLSRPRRARVRRLEHFRLKNCQIAGHIPSTVGCLTELKELRLSRNYFEGTVPETLGNCVRLKDLALSNNPRLSGSLPASLSRMPELKVSLPSSGMTQSFHDDDLRVAA